jgi:hypothetical protein
VPEGQAAIETGFTVTKRRSDCRQCLLSGGSLGWRKTTQLEGIHLGQAVGFYFHGHESVTGKFQAEGRPSSADFGLVVAKEISNHWGDAGDMNMQLVLAAAFRCIYCHSDLVTRQIAARPFFNKAAGVPCCLASDLASPRISAHPAIAVLMNPNIPISMTNKWLSSQNGDVRLGLILPCFPIRPFRPRNDIENDLSKRVHFVLFGSGIAVIRAAGDRACNRN